MIEAYTKDSTTSTRKPLLAGPRTPELKVRREDSRGIQTRELNKARLERRKVIATTAANQGIGHANAAVQNDSDKLLWL